MQDRKYHVQHVVAGNARAWGSLGAGAQTSGMSDGTVKIGVLTDMAGVFSDLAGAAR